MEGMEVMAKKLTVTDGVKPIYDIYIRKSYEELLSVLDSMNIKTKKICIVTDTMVAPLYLDEIKNMLHGNCKYVCEFIFPYGEEYKNLDVVRSLYTTLINEHFDRNDILFALGGGVVGDLTGYTAATYLRGIDFIQLPTTLLSQVDSSVGGKTGVDFDCYKNMVGAFYMPKLVYMNLSTLHSLDKRIFLSGMGEVIKYGLIKNKEFYNYIIANVEKIKQLDYDVLENIVYESCLMKKEIVEVDALEKGERALLNFGHTLGHSIEKHLNFSMYHGECVSLGMIGAAYISYKRNYILEEQLHGIEQLLHQLELPITISNLLVDEVLSSTKHDKKVEGDIIKFILLHNIGDGYIDKTVTIAEMKAAIEYLLKE